MRITEIEVQYGLTENLGDYNNCRPEARIKAELEEGDDYEASVAVLFEQARAKVHAEADAMLMRHNQAPRYYEGTRYSARAFIAHKTVVMYPSHLSVNGLIHSYLVKHRFPIDLVNTAARHEAEARDCLVIHCETQMALDATIEDFLAHEKAAREAAEAERQAQAAMQEIHGATMLDDDDDFGDEDESPDNAPNDSRW